MRIDVSFISVKQVRRNLEEEKADGTTLERTARMIRASRAEKLGQVWILSGSQEKLETFNTALFRTLQISSPSELRSV